MPLTDIDGQRLGDSVGDKLGNRNLIINGAMVHDQRNSGSSVTPTNAQYLVDRFKVGATQSSKFTAQQSTTAPTGFKNSLLLTSSSAFSLGASDEFEIIQFIEGNNVAHCGFGTSNAQTLTLSFYARSSLTGTFGGAIYNGAANRSYPFTYTISTADTFELQTVTFAGDTSGTWATDNTAGINVLFSLGAGSSKLGTPGAWTGSFKPGATGQTNLVATNGATLYLSGVQLEVGNTATPFEHRSYGDELARCLRYYELLSNCTGRTVNTTDVDVAFFFRVEKRATPSTPSSLRPSPGSIAQFGRAAFTVTGLNTVFSISKTQLGSNLTTADTGMTGGLFAASISGTPILEADAEL